MGIGRYVWALRARLVGPDRVVTYGQIQMLNRCGVLSGRGRARLVALLLRELAFGPTRFARVRVGDALAEIGSDDDFATDWKAFVEVTAGQPYDGDFTGAAVLDIGAHKGYFGAYTLARGASVVMSFEPAPDNFAALERAARPLGDRWLVRNAALGARAGVGVLLLDETSWAHSLLDVERPAGEQSTEIVTLEQALGELPKTAGRIIVKIDAEGSECEILGDTGPLGEVDVLMVEWHPAVARCEEATLLDAVESSRLRLVSRVDGVMHFERR